jgi:hypothetical protein
MITDHGITTSNGTNVIDVYVNYLKKIDAAGSRSFTPCAAPAVLLSKAGWLDLVRRLSQISRNVS